MSNRTDGVYEVDPISRIEGHLGVRVSVAGGVISEARAHGNLWRGFENFLLGRDPNDAITFTQRICGVCPVPHAQASTYAVEAALGYSSGHITFATGTLPADSTGIPAKAVLIRNLVLGAEFLMSSITHFYQLAAPSYVQGPAMPPWMPYFADGYYHDLLRSDLDARGNPLPSGHRAVPSRGADGVYSADLWSAVIRSYVKALRIRRLTFEAGALFAGRMPMTSTFVAGGVTFDGTENLQTRCDEYASLMAEVGRFIIQEYIPVVYTIAPLYPSYDNATNAAASPYYSGDSGYGAGLGRFLAWGAFPGVDAAGSLGLVGGFYDAASPDTAFTVANKAEVAAFLPGGASSVPAALTEDIASSRYEVDGHDSAAYQNGVHPYTSATSAYPGDVSRTKPQRAQGYSYMKAPRWNGQACEVGPLARMMVAGLLRPGEYAYATCGDWYVDYTVSDVPTGLMGLDPRMIGEDLGIAVIRAGLATLYTSTDGGATVVHLSASNIDSYSAPAIHAAYHYANPSGSTITHAFLMGICRDSGVNCVSGLSTLDRIRARALESYYLVRQILGAYSKATDAEWTNDSWSGGWVAQLKARTGNTSLDTATSTWRPLSVQSSGQGWGATEAPRGALMHQIAVSSGRITKYQCIVPTTWNGSPRDAAGNEGALERALVGVPFSAGGASFTSQDGATAVSSAGGVEAMRVAQSFDPCIACAVH
jgi:Ni,Fe-hydrogenase I large subunit